MGDHIQGAMLAKLDTLSATLLAAHSRLPVLWHDSPSIRAVVVIVIDVPMRGRILKRVCMIRRYLSHSYISSCGSKSGIGEPKSTGGERGNQQLFGRD